MATVDRLHPTADASELGMAAPVYEAWMSVDWEAHPSRLHQPHEPSPGPAPWPPIPDGTAQRSEFLRPVPDEALFWPTGAADRDAIRSPRSPPDSGARCPLPSAHRPEGLPPLPSRRAGPSGATGRGRLPGTPQPGAASPRKDRPSSWPPLLNPKEWGRRVKRLGSPAGGKSRDRPRPGHDEK